MSITSGLNITCTFDNTEQITTYRREVQLLEVVWK